MEYYSKTRIECPRPINRSGERRAILASSDLLTGDEDLEGELLTIFGLPGEDLDPSSSEIEDCPSEEEDFFTEQAIYPELGFSPAHRPSNEGDIKLSRSSNPMILNERFLDQDSMYYPTLSTSHHHIPLHNISPSDASSIMIGSL